jgi:hypothetical protein
MSSSSRVRLTRLRETTYGVLPTPAAMTVVRRTGGSFSADNTAEPSAEVREDLQVTDVARLDRMAKATIEDEWVYAAHDEELKDNFGNAWSATIALSALTLTFNNAASTIVRSAGNWTTDGIVVGGVYKFGAALTAANNGRKRVTAVNSATSITVASTLVDEVATANCTVAQGGHLRQGTTRYPVIFEELFPDVGATEFEQYIGMCNTDWSWQYDHPGKMTTTFSYEGSYGGYTASTAGNGTVTPYATNRVMNSADHWTAFAEGGASATISVKSFSLKHTAGKRRISGAGTLGNDDMGMNTFSLSGTMKVYNSTAARAVGVKAGSFADSALEWETVDYAGNCYHFYIPAINYSTGSPEAGAKDSDVYRTLNWIAKQSSTIASMIQVTRFAA